MPLVRRIRWLVIVMLGVGCVQSSSVTCSDQSVCPESKVCDTTHHLCVAQSQLDACTGLGANTACTADAISGFCTDGVCLAQACGDGIINGSEICDDGNQADGDGCSAMCNSTEQCGNRFVDFSKGEECDDGNHLDHDGCSSTCKLEQPRWVQHFATLTEHDSPAMAYDSLRDRVVAFGGRDKNGVAVADTMEWNGADWIVVNPPGAPTPRHLAAMAYDREHAQMVLFGGYNNGEFGDTWTWDGAVWKLADVAVQPPARFGAAMAYDPKRKLIVMFGGQSGDQVGNETWEFDGSTWNQVMTTTQPSERMNATAAYDPAIGAIVLVGGADQTSLAIADTWTYDGAWHDKTSGTNPAVYSAGMTYDIAGQRLLLFGGYSNVTTVVQDTWTWSGSAWTLLAGTTPPAARSDVRLTSTRSQLLMFGGRFVSGLAPDTTYTLVANKWTAAKQLGPRAGQGFANDPLDNRAITFGGQATTNFSAPSNETDEITRTGLAVRTTPAALTARAFPSVAYDVAHRNIVLFGGGNDTVSNNDTWVWDGTTWTAKTVAGPPPSTRSAATMAFDGHRMALVGGAFTTDDGDPKPDAFTFDGTTWAPAPAFYIGANFDAAASYSPIANTMVLFGGYSPSPSTTTYAFDDATLTPYLQGNPPLARQGATMTWNAARARLTLIGGSSGGSTDVFEWDETLHHWTSVAAINAPPPRQDHAAIQSLDGAGVFVLGGFAVSNGVTSAPLSDMWQFEWSGPGFAERCDGSDLDGDGLTGCDDPDCWPICAPLCPPGTTCDPAAPSCGDGVCSGPRESCSTCPADCGTCAPSCGDGVCSPGEICPGDC